MKKLLLSSLIVLAGSLPPVFAAQQLQQDPVETASATLSKTLSANQAEQNQLMQMRAQQLALHRSGLETPAPAPAGTSAAAQPLAQTAPVIAEALLSPELAWLAGQSNPAVTGFTPVAGREGLLVSYTIPPADGLAFLRGRSWTYDNAAASIAFLLQGQPDAARRVLAALRGLQAADGSLGFSYQVDSTFVDPMVRTGTLAWVGYAMALYQRQTGDASFQAGAEKIGSYLKGLQSASGSLKGGPSVSWVSTEHNIDAYFFFRELYRVTGQSSYSVTATQIKNSLLADHWTGSVSSGHFLQGINDPTPALDANSWGSLFLSAVGRTAQAKQALKYAESTFQNTQKVPGTSVRITGYSPDSAKKTVWVEGTAGVAAAYQRTGQASKANSIQSEINDLQKAWQSLGNASGALPYASPRYVNPDGDTLANLCSVVATAWDQITRQILGNGSSRFWDAD